ncbi:uroporphyrinogen-III synthase [Saprospiraceae bacterium]|jgi:uroporphyrinogen-III synthase|nr:uroporphyrinogen-III synthase [Bacteroidota bacterium]MDB4727787.1 uroporphyrinogen-III synthase [Saprospiraceae bacterium]MDF1864052.1 uroporphyrinogen-III synthase [Saprospiraceae bacterium]
MATNGKALGNLHEMVKSILISQPKPERSPYYELEKKFGLQIDWRPFIHVEAVTEKEFRKQRVRPDEFSAIVLTSKNSVDHFFRMCTAMRIEMSQDTKYFCLTEAVANYLQKFIIYRKRKVFSGKRTIMDLKPYLLKHKDKEKFLLPCSNLGAKAVSNFLDENEFNWQEAMMYRTVSSDLSDLKDITYDVLVFFSPLGIKSLYDNFPGFKQNQTRIAVFGNSTSKAVVDRGLEINIKAPAPETPSMTMALEHYLKVSNPKI